MVFRRSAKAYEMTQNFFYNLELLGFGDDNNADDMSDLPRNDDTQVNAPNNGMGNIYRAGGNLNSTVDQGVLYLAEQIGSLYENAECSDVVLLVEDREIPAHKVILAARSSYFRAMFFGGMRETSERNVKLEETPVQAFRILLRYIYTGRIQLHAIQFDLVVDVLGLVHKYGFNELEYAIAEYLKSILQARNVCIIYTSAIMYSMRGLASFCLDFIDSYAPEIIQTDGFLQLSASALAELIGRTSFCAPEIEIFKVVLRWMDRHPEEVEFFPTIITHIRLSLIKLDDLLNIVRPSGFIPPDVLLDAINDQTKKKSSDLIYRGFLLPNVNIASSASYQAKVISGDNVHSLLIGGPHLYENQDRNYAKHMINDMDPGIIVELNKAYIINHIKLHLFERDQRAYMYYVEVSMDQRDWVRVIDHSHYLCRSTQNLYFTERVVRYIRVKGTHSSLSATFYLQSLEAMYTTEPFEIDTMTTLLIPHHNIATIPNNALVIEGVSRNRNTLLNGDITNYDWDNGYTCHQLGSGSITIQLPQPYLIDSMRLLLWDCDDRQYSYYIQVGVDNDNWDFRLKVCERDHAKGWQLIRFDRQPIVFIKIVGTFNSANEVFHCVHFECPTQVDHIAESQRTNGGVRQRSRDFEDMPSTSRAQNIPQLEEVIEDDVQARLELLNVNEEVIDRDLEQGINDEM